MGCDIHIYVEKKHVHYKTKKPVWINADKWTVNPDNALYQEEGANRFHIDYHDAIYSGRNYDLFSILADVRNGYGFAGCDTGDGFNPIAMPKGLPDDVSPEVKELSDDWGCDGHSHSFFTLKELLDYNWQQATTHRGWVDEETYKQFKETGNPYPSSGGVSGHMVMHLSNDEMDRLIGGTLTREAGKHYYTQIQWQETYAECCKEFIEKTIPKLKELAKISPYKEDIDPESVRIVFWFDN